MRATLPVHLNRDRIHTIEVKAAAFEPTGSFVIEFVNHGQAIHVHIHLDDELSEGARLSSTNCYVEADEHRQVEVTVDPERLPLHGKLKLQTGYGSTTEYVDIDVTPPEPQARSVDVDETLSRPATDESTSSPLSTIEEMGVLPLVLLAVGAVGLAAVAAVVANSAVVFAGVIVVLVAVGGAVYATLA